MTQQMCKEQLHKRFKSKEKCHVENKTKQDEQRGRGPVSGLISAPGTAPWTYHDLPLFDSQ